MLTRSDLKACLALLTCLDSVGGLNLGLILAAGSVHWTSAEVDYFASVVGEVRLAYWTGCWA